MRKIFNCILVVTGLAFFLGSCEKAKELPYYGLGNPVTLSTSTKTLAPQVADSNKSILTLSWTFPNYATDSSNMKYIVEIDSTGKNFANEVTRTVTTNLNTSFTGRDLNTILLNYGYSVGAPVKLDFRVKSSYANNNEQYVSNITQVSITPYSDPSKLATENTSVSGTLATATQHSNTFTWSPAFPGYSGTVSYVLQYDSAGKGFASPQEIAGYGGTSVYSASLTQADMNNTAINSGIPMNNQTGTVEYRVKATTASGAIAYSNAVTVSVTTYIPVLRFYMPGGYQAATGNGNDWDPGSAPQLIRDLRSPVFNKLYYIYIYLPANAEFKFTQGQSWDVNYGDGGSGTLVPGGGNLKVVTAGVYRISIDVANMKYDIKQGRMGFVGDATAAGWDPPSVFPSTGMAFLGTNKFLGLSSFTAGGWKMIDNDQWNNGSNAADETRSYGSNGGSGSTMEVNGPNFPNITSADTYRVIWDGTDVDNIKYEIFHGLRVVGAFQGWDPSTAPDMTYQGNGVWKTTITLPAGEFKFVSADGWGFNYGGSGGTISRDGPNLNVAGGTYTITVDEYNQTYTIL
jgi:hypothetical protein